MQGQGGGMSLIFPIGYKPICLGYQTEDKTLTLRVKSKEEAQRLVKEQLSYFKDLIRALDLEEIRVGYSEGSKYFQVKNPPIFNHNRSIRQMEKLLKYPYLNGTLLSGYDYDKVSRLADEVASLNRPAFLVSMSLHRNLIVNEAALEYMESTPQELFAKSLAKLWVPPSSFKPINYEVNLPPHLQEIHNLLRQQKDLLEHKYYGWKVNGPDTKSDWVRWTSDIRHRNLGVGADGQEHHCRLMVSRGHDVMVY
jgi:hypothetical protein